MATRVPRKGVLQAAAAAGVPIYTPDLNTSAFAVSLVTARQQGVRVAFDAAEELLALAQTLGERPRLGIIRTGETAVDALLAQARDVLPVLGQTAPMLMASVSLAALPGAGQITAEHDVCVAADASLVLPLLVTGLAQRLAGARRRGRRSAARREQPEARREQAVALA